MHHFFSYCPLSHSLSNAYHTGCYEKVSSSIGHGGTSSFSQVIHIKPTVELAVELVVELPVQLLVFCVWFVKMSLYHHVLYYCQWEWGRDITTSTSMPVKLWHSSRHYTEERTSWSRSFRLEIVLSLSNLFHKSISSQSQLFQLQPTNYSNSLSESPTSRVTY